MDTGKHSTIRSIGRGLEVLRVINRYRCASMVDIAEKSRVPYPTACRIVQTLVHEGMIERQGTRRYRPTALVRSLSLGYEPEDELAEIARPHLEQLTTKILWPVYLSCRVGMNMVVKVSTDTLTSLTFNHCNPGYTMPLTESSSGKAFLAFTPSPQKRLLLDSAFGAGGKTQEANTARTRLDRELDEVGQRGFSGVCRHLYTENPGKTSAISVPVLIQEKAAAALSVLFFASAYDIPKAAKMFLGALQSTARAIAGDFIRR